jgi:two-component system response regulator NreC
MIHSEREGSMVGQRKLTPRERRIILLVAIGRKSREIAEELGIGVKTVETHRANLNKKLGLRNLTQLIKYAIQKGLVKLDEE